MNNYREYILMNKDKEILNFISETNEFGEVCLEEVGETLEGLPIGYEDIQTFIEHRKAPKHRRHIAELMRMAGCDDLNGFLDVSKALSLNDTFWVKEKGSILKWSDVNLYQNDFNEVIARLAFEGGEQHIDFSSTSPEFGTEGRYAKCWIRNEDGVFLLKTGIDEAGLEPYSEYYASQLAEVICESSVKYLLDTHHDRVVSKCALFTSEKEGFVSALKCVDPKEHNRISYLLNYFSKLVLENDFRRMIVLDALILNTDRHAGNYGFIVDNDTQEIKRMAPVFDHNLSLLHSVKELTESNIEQYLKNILPRIGADFNTTANLVLSSDIRSDLKNLKGFTFESVGGMGLPKRRVQFLEKLIDVQIDNILEAKSLYFSSKKLAAWGD